MASQNYVIHLTPYILGNIYYVRHIVSKLTIGDRVY